MSELKECASGKYLLACDYGEALPNIKERQPVCAITLYLVNRDTPFLCSEGMRSALYGGVGNMMCYYVSMTFFFIPESMYNTSSMIYSSVQKSAPDQMSS